MPSNPSNFIPVPHPVVEPSRLITRPWMMFFQSLVDGLVNAGNVFGPSSSLNNAIVLFSGLTGKLIKAATGTGFVTATNGVYGTSNASAASKLLGRGSAGGAGIWEEISLGAGLTMSGTTLSAVISVDYVVMSDGATPPTPMSIGGNFMYVGYTP